MKIRKILGLTMALLLLCSTLGVSALAADSHPVALASKTTLAKAAKATRPTIVLSDTTIVLTKNKSHSLTATIVPADPTNPVIKWKSSNKKVATVSKNGKVKAKKDGICNISASVAGSDMHKVYCRVYVQTKSKANNFTLIIDGATLKLPFTQDQAIAALPGWTMGRGVLGFPTLYSPKNPQTLITFDPEGKLFRLQSADRSISTKTGLKVGMTKKQVLKKCGKPTFASGYRVDYALPDLKINNSPLFINIVIIKGKVDSFAIEPAFSAYFDADGDGEDDSLFPD